MAEANNKHGENLNGDYSVRVHEFIKLSSFGIKQSDGWGVEKMVGSGKVVVWWLQSSIEFHSIFIMKLAGDTVVVWIFYCGKWLTYVPDTII